MQNPFLGDGKAAITRRLPNVDPETVDDYIADAWAKAVGVAPCVALETFPPEGKPEKAAELTAILRAIILRWHESQSGALVGKTQMAGPYQQSIQFDQRPKRGYTLMPSEIVDLQNLCKKKGRPFTFDTLPSDFEVKPPLYGVVVNGSTEGLNGPPGEWSPDAVEPDV